MLEHLSAIVPHLDYVKTYLDSMQLEYRVIEPTNIGALDPLSIYIPFDCMKIGIRYNDDGIGIIIRKDQWK